MKTNLTTNIFLIQRLDYLIRSKSTGSPKQLASRFKISERDLFRLLDDLRNQGFPIKYDKASKSYFYYEKVFFSFVIIVGDDKLLDVKSGGGA